MQTAFRVPSCQVDNGGWLGSQDRSQAAIFGSPLAAGGRGKEAHMVSARALWGASLKLWFSSLDGGRWLLS